MTDMTEHEARCVRIVAEAAQELGIPAGRLSAILEDYGIMALIDGVLSCRCHDHHPGIRAAVDELSGALELAYRGRRHVAPEERAWLGASLDREREEMAHADHE